MWAHGRWTVWNELIETSTFKKLYQTINNAKYHMSQQYPSNRYNVYDNITTK